MEHEAVAVVDFGGQYAHLIATKVRRQRVLAEIRQPDDPIEAFAKYKGIILSGSPALSALGEEADYTKAIYDLDVPILGFCFGHQEIAKHYGGQVVHGHPEWGSAELHMTAAHPIFKGLAQVERVWMSHNDSVTALGAGFVELGYSKLGAQGAPHRFAAIGNDRLRRYGFQFHPEVDDTEHGDEMIGNFVLEICGCRPSWTMERYLEEQIERVRAQVGASSVFLLASGGVDSSVCAALFGRALRPGQLRLLHIDNGLMRKDESARVLELLRSMDLGENLHFVDASQDFLTALSGAVEPEVKRRIIGETFIEVFEREARRLNLSGCLLGQVEFYPDTIETGGTKRADTIKTHHNRVGVVQEMIAAGRVVEPLADLYKVEVRELGLQLGLPEDLIWRHPFPGPGLGVRLLCCSGASQDSAAELQKIERAAAAVIGRYGLQGVVLPIRSVGVKADLRSYEHALLVEGSSDWNVLQEAAGQLFKSVPGLNRCLWNLGPRLPHQLRPLGAGVTRARLDLLRAADHLVMEGLRRHGLYREIWQCPVVFLPLEADGDGAEFCILRPIVSERGMTAAAACLPREFLEEVTTAILALPGISGLAFDLTSKPPGTIEWE